VNESELKSACDILGSAEFWDCRRAGPAASVSVSTHGPAWENANRIADACLRLMFLDADGFSRARQYRDEMKSLSMKVSELNETRKRLSGRASELSNIRQALSSMAEQGWVEAQQEETKKPDSASWMVLSLRASPQFGLMLESAIKLDAPLFSLSLSSLWVYGRRRLARKMARDGDVDVGQVRHWASLLMDIAHTFATDEASPGEKEPSRGEFFAATADDLHTIERNLTEQANIDNAALSDLSSELDDAKQRLRKELVRLLLAKNLSPGAVGGAASSPWGMEVRVLREALWFPLGPVETFSDSDGATRLSPEKITAILSENDLSPGFCGLSYISGRLAGGNLDRQELFALHKSEFMDYLRRTVFELGPDAADMSFESLPGPDGQAQDARASLDIARRTAMEIVKLRSYVKASLDLEIEEVSRIVESLKLSIGEGLRRSDTGSDDLKELRGAISSFRRDLARLAKSVQDEMSSTLTSDIIKDFLFVIDDLSRIMNRANGEGAGGFCKALKMVLSKLDGALAGHKIHRIDAVGEQFSPSVHDCVGTRKVAGVKDGAILEEVSIGYTIGDKVLRPAKVIVRG